MPIDTLGALATDDDTATSYLNPTLLSQADALARRKAVLAQQAIDSARQLGIFRPPEAPQEQPGWTSAVTGTRMVGRQPKTSVLEGLRPLIAGLVNERAQASYDTDASGYQRLESSEARKHMAEKPADDAPDMVRLEWAQKGMNIPSLMPTMKAYIDDTLIKAPERQEAREFRRSESAANRQERIDRAAQADQTRRDLAQQSNDLRATIAQAMGVGAGTFTHVGNTSDGTQGVYVNSKDPTRTSMGPPKAKEPKPMSDGEREKMDTLQNNADTLAGLSQQLKANPNMAGGLGSWLSANENLPLGKYFNGLGISSDTAEWWSQLRGITATMKHALYGASFTAGEKKLADQIGVNTFQNVDQVQRYVDRLAAANARSVARRTAWATEPGAKMDPETGGVKMSDGSIYPGTAGPASGRVASGPVTDAPPQDNSIRANVERGFAGNATQREASGQSLMQEWRSANPQERAQIEQRASSAGITFNGRPYRGGPFNSREAWGEK